MKKVILFIAAVAVMFAGCQNKTAYTVEGTVADTNYEGKYVYLQKATDSAMVKVDSTLLTDGKFQFKGNIENPEVRFVLLDESVKGKNKGRVLFLLEPGNIKINIDTVNTIGGTSVNDAFNDFNQKQEDFYKKMNSLRQEYDQAAAEGTMTDSLDAALQAVYEKEVENIGQINYEYVKNNMNNELGRYVFMTSAGNFKPEQQKELLDMTDDTYKAKPQIQRLLTRLDNLEKVSEGKMFVDFTLDSPEGTPISLSDYAGKGKYVLIDFWASWCGPCREEMPNVVEAYKLYKNKGFEIVGVSLDNDKDKWVQGIKDLNITWPQMSDLKMWDSQVVNLYAFNGIPHTVLLDKDGKIIAKNLRGDKLKEKLQELMP